ncbi:MAG: hypothetical protein Q9169_007271 [Polycauliona sp. 2 TL-2023]
MSAQDIQYVESITGLSLLHDRINTTLDNRWGNQTHTDYIFQESDVDWDAMNELAESQGLSHGGSGKGLMSAEDKKDFPAGEQDTESEKSDVETHSDRGKRRRRPKIEALQREEGEQAERKCSNQQTLIADAKEPADRMKDNKIRKHITAEAELKEGQEESEQEKEKREAGQQLASEPGKWVHDPNLIEPSRPTYLKVHRKHLEPDTLDAYDLPWEWDYIDVARFELPGHQTLA